MKIERIAVKNAELVRSIEKIVDVSGCIGCKGCNGVCTALLDVLTVPAAVASRRPA